MHGSTLRTSGSAFRTSHTTRAQRRADGPTLTLVVGGAEVSPAHSSVVPRAHPGFEGFTPDDIPGEHARPVVHRSGPESVTDRRSSRGITSPDFGGPAHSGPGPHAPQAELIRWIADQLDAFDAQREVPDAPVVQLPRQGNAAP